MDSPDTTSPRGVRFAPRSAYYSELTWSSDTVTAGRAWQALCRTYAAETQDRTAQRAKLMINGKRVYDMTSWPTDESVPHGAWLAKRCRPDDHVLVLARDVQQYDRVLFQGVVELMAPHVPFMGVTPGHVEVEIFFGNYSVTPGGIHREKCTNAHFVIEGRKSMHFWFGSDWIAEGTRIRKDVAPEAGQQEEFLPNVRLRDALACATSLSAGGGGGFHWKSGVWHVGETHGPSLALNFATYTNTIDIDAKMLGLWGGQLHGEVPADWFAEYRRVTSSDASDGALLARLSALGMRPAAPVIAADTVAVPRYVKRVSSAPVLWFAQDGERVVVAALGHFEIFDDQAAVRAWLAEALATLGPSEVPSACAALARWLCTHGITEPTGGL